MERGIKKKFKQNSNKRALNDERHKIMSLCRFSGLSFIIFTKLKLTVIYMKARYWSRTQMTSRSL